jgi:hypothetical protein
MWESRRLTAVWAFTASYRASFTHIISIFHEVQIETYWFAQEQLVVRTVGIHQMRNIRRVFLKSKRHISTWLTFNKIQRKINSEPIYTGPSVMWLSLLQWDLYLEKRKLSSKLMKYVQSRKESICEVGSSLRTYPDQLMEPSYYNGIKEESTLRVWWFHL